MKINDARDLVTHYERLRVIQEDLDSYVKDLKQTKKFEEDLERLEAASREIWRLTYKYHFGTDPGPQKVD